ncbi:MAG: hypothetical protein ABII27_08160 [bacterium]
MSIIYVPVCSGNALLAVPAFTEVDEISLTDIDPICVVAAESFLKLLDRFEEISKIAEKGKRKYYQKIWKKAYLEYGNLSHIPSKFSLSSFRKMGFSTDLLVESLRKHLSNFKEYTSLWDKSDFPAGEKEIFCNDTLEILLEFGRFVERIETLYNLWKKQNALPTSKFAKLNESERKFIIRSLSKNYYDVCRELSDLMFEINSFVYYVKGSRSNKYELQINNLDDILETSTFYHSYSSYRLGVFYCIDPEDAIASMQKYVNAVKTEFIEKCRVDDFKDKNEYENNMVELEEAIANVERHIRTLVDEYNELISAKVYCDSLITSPLSINQPHNYAVEAL